MSLGRRTPILGLVVSCIGLLVPGCGQDTPESLTFALPRVNIDISSGGPGWRSVPSGLVLPNMVCAGPQALGTDCCLPPGSVFDCGEYPLACDPANNLCALTFDVAQSASVDLVGSVPEVAAVDGRAFSRVFLRSLTVTVDEPPALPIRSALLYVGPSGSEGVGGPDTYLLGTVALTAEPTAVPLVGSAQPAFSALARDYRVPFVFWLSAHVVVANGSAPAGTVEFVVEASAEATY